MTLCTLDSVLSALHSRTLCTSHCALIVHSAPSSRLCALALSVLCTLASVLSHLTFVSAFSHSLHSRVCTLPLHSRTVLSSCTLFPPLDSVPLYSLYSRLCILALPALSTLYSRTLSALSILYSRLSPLYSVLSHCALVVHCGPSS